MKNSLLPRFLVSTRL